MQRSFTAANTVTNLSRIFVFKYLLFLFVPLLWWSRLYPYYASVHALSDRTGQDCGSLYTRTTYSRRYVTRHVKLRVLASSISQLMRPLLLLMSLEFVS